MTAGNPYKITKEIKLHTKPLRKTEIAKTGVFVRETPKFYIFDKFRVKKKNVKRLEGVGDEWDAETIEEFVKRLEEHYPRSPSVCNTIKKVADEMLREASKKGEE